MRKISLLKILLFMAVGFMSLVVVGCRQETQAPKSATTEVVTAKSIATRMVKTMSLEEKIGQMLIIGIEGTDLDSGAVEMLEKYHVGGVILFDRNMESKYQVTGLNANLQRINSEYNKLPLYLCVDQEGGNVARMRHALNVAPTAETLAKENDLTGAKRFAYQTAAEIKTLGFNVNFAPVADIALPAERSYGSDAATVQKFTEAVCEGYKKADIIYSLKHFPGIGKSKVDPHAEQFEITAKKEQLMQEDILPFKNIINKFDNQDFMVMVGHLIYTDLDKEPASVSPKIIKELLRQEIGFQGLVVTDDMEMGALTSLYNFSEMGVKALQGGVDLMLVCHKYEHQKQVYLGILNAIKNGTVAESDLDATVVRIVENKITKLLDKKTQENLELALREEA